MFYIAVFNQDQVAALTLTLVTAGFPDFQCVNLPLSVIRSVFPSLV
jgi:hypothetical protein